MSDGPRNDAPDPAIQAAGDRLLSDHAREVLEYRPSRPRRVLPAPELITLGALGWLLEQVKGDIPPDHPADYEYSRVQALIRRIPGIRELKHRLDTELEADLTGPALVALRRRLSRCTGSRADDVDRLLISEVAARPWDAPASPPAAAPPEGNPPPGRPESAPDRFTRLDGGLEPFDPAACISYPIEMMKGGPALAYLELSDGRVVEQRGFLADGWTTTSQKPLGWGEWKEVRHRAPDVYHAEYREVEAATAERARAARGQRSGTGAPGPPDGSVNAAPASPPAGPSPPGTADPPAGPTRPHSGGSGRPAARPEAAADQQAPPAGDNVEPVVLGGPDDPVFVWGKEKDPLPPAQYRVIKALVEARAKGRRLSKDRLCTATKDREGNTVEDPVGALERMRHRDSDWRSVIDMAGTPGRGYGLKDKPPRPTQRNRETHPRRPRGG